MVKVAQYPVCSIAQSALHFTPWQTCPFRHQLGCSWKHSSHGSNYAEWLITRISNTVYSQVLIYTAEWTEASWRDQKCPNLKTIAKGGFKPGLSQLWVRHSTTDLPVGRVVHCVKLHFIPGWPYKSKHHFDMVTGNQYFIYQFLWKIKNVQSWMICRVHPSQSESFVLDHQFNDYSVWRCLY